MSWRGMSVPQPKRSKARNFGGPQPSITPSTSNEDLFKGPVETFEERVARDRGDFLRDLYGDQDEEEVPKTRRGRRE